MIVYVKAEWSWTDSNPGFHDRLCISGYRVTAEPVPGAIACEVEGLKDEPTLGYDELGF